MYSHLGHFIAMRFENALPYVGQILHVMFILILDDVLGVSRSYDHFLIPIEITSGTPYVQFIPVKSKFVVYLEVVNMECRDFYSLYKLTLQISVVF